MLGFIRKKANISKFISVDNVLPGVENKIYDVIVQDDSSLVSTALTHKCQNCKCTPTANDFNNSILDEKCVGTMWSCPKCKHMTYFHKKIEKYTFGKKTIDDISSLM